MVEHGILPLSSDDFRIKGIRYIVVVEQAPRIAVNVVAIRKVVALDICGERVVLNNRACKFRRPAFINHNIKSRPPIRLSRGKFWK
jgi:hypothetical protein